jgi:cell division protein FtsW
MNSLKRKKIDSVLLASILALMISGFFIFSSASLGLLARTETLFKSVIINQTILGLIGGSIAMFITSRIPYTFWKKYSLYIFIVGIAIMIMVLIPNIGYMHGGARRWIRIAFFSFQPAEFYKIAFVIFYAALLSSFKIKVKSFKFGTLPFLIMTGISGILLLLQPDTDTFGVIVLTGLAMYIISGARWRDLLIIIGIGLIGITILAFARPYLMDRIQTFINPGNDPTGKGYQIQQSMIAIGSGGLTGRGFGQSVQKFNFLPEPIGDSIYAVAAEEFGFIGSIFIIMLYLFFVFRGFRVATTVPDPFGALLAAGIVMIVISGSMMNISSMLGIIPLSGLPLIFMSHGGTALFFTLASMGILLNISRYRKY